MGWYSSVTNFAYGRSPERDEAMHDDEVGGSGGVGQASPPRLSPGQHVASVVPADMHAVGHDRPSLDADQIYAAFDASQPVEEPHDLHGREAEVSALLSGVLRRRNHGIVAGARGSGKTSLVRVFGQHADRDGVVVLYSACDDGTSFGVMLRSYLEQIPPEMVEAGAIELFEQRVLSFGADSSPYQATVVLAMLRYSQLVVVLDEFDRVSDPAMHDKISSLLKLVSDARLPVRFVLVGGASSFASIVEAHPSLMRHVTIVSMAPLSEAAAGELLDACAQRCGMTLSASAREQINAIACGSPFHVRLFGMHAAMAAAEATSHEVDFEHVMLGLESAFDEWAALNPVDAAAFQALVRSAHGSAAAMIDLAEGAARMRGTSAVRPGSDRGSMRPEIEQQLAAFPDTIQRIDGRIMFRDATAPQFLLALRRLTQAQAAPTPIKGGKKRA